MGSHLTLAISRYENWPLGCQGLSVCELLIFLYSVNDPLQNPLHVDTCQAKEAHVTEHPRE